MHVIEFILPVPDAGVRNKQPNTAHVKPPHLTSPQLPATKLQVTTDSERKHFMHLISLPIKMN